MLQNYGKGDKNTKKRALKGILISVLSLFLVFTIVITAFVIDKFNKMGDKIDEKPQETVPSEENQKDDIIFAEEPDSIEIDIGSSDFQYNSHRQYFLNQRYHFRTGSKNFQCPRTQQIV